MAFDSNIVAGNFGIEDNMLLETCNLGWICEYVSNGKPYSIQFNAVGCSSKNDILDSCDCPLILSFLQLVARAYYNMESTTHQMCCLIPGLKYQNELAYGFFLKDVSN